MSPYWIAILLTAMVQLVVFLRWLYRRMRDDEVARIFMRDIAENHLQHIYSALNAIAQHHNIDISEPPPIKWISFEKEEHRK